MPATTLVDSCYQNMFVRCQELKPSNDPDEGIKFFDCPTDCSDLSIDQMFRQATAEF
ncbi:MAG: hypothetical protein MJ219_00545 [Mycoplasmoidaceae bacterium]|nr:hypothetical protein [Mycoplasmoidaceae bacterium]